MQTANIAFSTAGIISMLVGFALPILVGYFTKASLNAGVKAAILAASAGVSGVLTQWLDAINNSQHFAWQAAVLSAVATWLVSEASYLKIWKPSGVSDLVQAAGPVADATDAVTSDQLASASMTTSTTQSYLTLPRPSPIPGGRHSASAQAATPPVPPSTPESTTPSS